MYSLHLTHPKWTHTRSSGQPCYSARGAVGGSVPCSRTPQSWYWRWILPPPTIPAGPEIRTHNLPVTSPTRYPLGHDCPLLILWLRVIDTMISAFSTHSFNNLNRRPTSSLSSSSLVSFRSSASMLGGQRESQTWENVTLTWQRDLFVLPICSTSVCMCVLNVWVCLKQSNHMRLYHITSFKEKSHKHSALMLNSDVMWR